MLVALIRKHYLKLIFLTAPVAAFSFVMTVQIRSYLDFQESQLNSDMVRSKLLLKSELEKYLLGLHGAKGVILAIGPNFSLEQFRRYALARNHFKDFEGALGFGFIRKLHSSEFPEYIRKQRKVFKNFEIHPPNVAMDAALVIETIEPVEKNGPALGLNVAFEEKRRNAAIRSAEFGIPLLTEKIKLVQVDIKHSGFLYYLPVYKSPNIPSTFKEREESLIGWVYAPIVLDFLLKAVSEKLGQEIHLSIQVGDDPSISEVGKEAATSLAYANTIVDSTLIGGLNWQISLKHSPDSVHRALLIYFLAYLSGAALIYIFYRYATKILKEKNRSFTNQSKWIKAIVESTELSIISTDPNGLIQTFNSGAEKILGYKASEMVGIHSPGILHVGVEVSARAVQLSKELGKPIEAGFEAFVAKAKLGNTDTNDWTYIKKNGEHIKVRLSVTAIKDEADFIIGYLGVAADLTLEIQNRNTIEIQRAKMIEASKMSTLGEMAAGLAHEINTPLAVIVSKSSSIKKEIALGKLDTQSILNHIQRIEKTAYHISRIIKGLRLFSRKSDNDLLTDVQLDSVVSLTLDLCHEKIKRTGIHLENKIQANVHVLGRESELSQVIMNLISNGIDATAHLEEKWIRIESTEVGGTIYLTITDSGKGIAPEIVDKMMNPFFTTKEVGKGTGLGLSLSKGIIENFNGRLYYNRRSENTQFVVELNEYNAHLKKKAS